MGEKTIFILGAGASAAYGLPTGAKLKTAILDSIYSNRLLLFVQNGFARDHVLEFGRVFAESQVDTIDFFLSQRGNEHYSKVAKFAITYEIAKCEVYDLLGGFSQHDAGNYAHRIEIECHQTGWYKYVWNRMQMALERFHENAHFAFITFNYDRSLEEFLYRAFSALNFRANLNQAQIRSYLSKIQIIHVHGKIAPLPWQSERADETAEYGCGDLQKLVRVSTNIKIISESKPEDEGFMQARQLFKDNPGARVIFLGFGFHEENLHRLGFEGDRSRDAPWLKALGPIHATSRGLSESDLTRSVKSMGHLFTSTKDTDCLSFVRSIL